MLTSLLIKSLLGYAAPFVWEYLHEKVRQHKAKPNAV